MASRENPDESDDDLERWNQAGAIFGLPPDTLTDFYLYAFRVHAYA